MNGMEQHAIPALECGPRYLVSDFLPQGKRELLYESLWMAHVVVVSPGANPLDAQSVLAKGYCSLVLENGATLIAIRRPLNAVSANVPPNFVSMQDWIRTKPMAVESHLVFVSDAQAFAVRVNLLWRTPAPEIMQALSQNLISQDA